MKYCIPEIALHLDLSAVLSIDISSCGRLATSSDDKRICIWKPIINTSSDIINNNKLNKNQSDVQLQYLSSISFHNDSVNCIRFSPCCKYLASASSDNWIILWELCTDSENNDTSSSNLNNEQDDDLPVNIENWKRIKQFRGHNTEIYSLNWSSDSQYLMSGSLDGTVIIWNVNDGVMSQPRIEDHTHYVQGVCFDPLMKYIATQSSDRSVKLYKLRNNQTKHKKSIVWVWHDTIKRRDTRRIAGQSNANKFHTANNNNTSNITDATISAGIDSTDPTDAHDIVNDKDSDNDKLYAQHSHQLFVDEHIPTFYRRLTFSPDGTFLCLPAGQYIDISNNTTQLTNESHDNTNTKELSHNTTTNTVINSDDEIVDITMSSTRSFPESSPNHHLSHAPNQHNQKIQYCYYLYHRADFKSPVAYIPTPEPVVGIKFNPIFYQLRNRDILPKRVPSHIPNSELTDSHRTLLCDLQYRMIYAVICIKSILVYDTESYEPLLVCSNIHYSKLTDCTWSSDGLTLIVSSTDGYISFYTFTQDELGDPLSTKDNDTLQQSLNTARTRNIDRALNPLAKKTKSTTTDITVPSTIDTIITPTDSSISIVQPSIDSGMIIDHDNSQHGIPSSSTQLPVQSLISPSKRKLEQLSISQYAFNTSMDTSHALASIPVAAVYVPINNTHTPSIKKKHKPATSPTTTATTIDSSCKPIIDKPAAAEQFEVEGILDHKYIDRQLRFRVRWAGYTEEHDTWEPKRNIKNVHSFIIYENQMIVQDKIKAEQIKAEKLAAKISVANIKQTNMTQSMASDTTNHQSTVCMEDATAAVQSEAQSASMDVDVPSTHNNTTGSSDKQQDTSAITEHDQPTVCG